MPFSDSANEPHPTPTQRRNKKALTPDDLDATAETVLRAATNLVAFAALMRRLNIDALEFNGAGLIEPTENNLQKWYRNVRANIAGHDSFPDEGLPKLSTRKADSILREIKKGAREAVQKVPRP